MIRFKYWTLLLCLSFSSILSAQLTQTIRGKVIDQNSRQPLQSANILLTNDSIVAATDSNGVFRFENVEVGRYRIQASYVGYEPYLSPEILLESGKEQVLTIELFRNPSLLNTIEVSAQNGQVTHPVSVKTFTVEQSFRYPATFYDPARLVTTYAGVVNDNDQANGISVRGNSPNGLLWRLEGIDIVNPNHTANAGTRSDRVTQNGGGVNILSNQLLDNSYFYTGAFPSRFGNALSGVLDMHLRDGNNEQAEYTAQLSLIGIDLAAEGPFSKKKNASYLVNYRYSTIGLLGAMGLDLGDEAINFQDLSFNLVFPGKNGRRFTLFGMGGLSENIFESPIDTAEWEIQKDRFNIRFRSQMGAIGASYVTPVGKNGSWKTVLAASGVESTRVGEELSINRNIIGIDTDTLREARYSLHTRFQFNMKNNTTFQVGAIATQQQFSSKVFGQRRDTIAFGEGEGLLLQPYLHWTAQATPQLKINVGVHAMYFGPNSNTSLEPRLSARYYISPDASFNLGYGLHSQQQPLNLYFSVYDGDQNHRNLEFTRAHHIVLGYQKNFTNALQLKVEGYYQDLFDVPVTPLDNPTSFSALNLLETGYDQFLVNEGTGMNYGLEVSLEKRIKDNYYYLINATYYESKYTGSDGVQRDTRFNGNYIFNATAGKEFRWQSEEDEKVKILGINGRIVYLGGFRTSPIDVSASAFQEETVFVESEAFSLQQPNYFKVDFRIYYKRNYPTFSSTLALDIQNLTNQENLAFSYFDTQQNQIVEQNQLGLIPVISYRLEF